MTFASRGPRALRSVAVIRLSPCRNRFFMSTPGLYSGEASLVWADTRVNILDLRHGSRGEIPFSLRTPSVGDRTCFDEEQKPPVYAGESLLRRARAGRG